MHEENIVIKTKDGNLDSRIFVTDKKNLSNIIFYMDAPGIREELRNMARKIAQRGFNVILPNLFYRVGKEGQYPFDQKNYSNKKIELNKMIETMNKTSNAMIESDTQFILEYLSKNFSNKPVGVLGYCMSGRFVISCAAKYPDKIKAIASFYGVDIYTNKKDSPHLKAKNIKGEIYLAFAEKDYWVPEGVLKKIINYFSKISAKVNIEVYPNTDHGFAFPSRSTYVEEAEKKHWNELFSLYERNLR